jgi:tetratricopeptide (TPR) repeat protein
MSDSNLNGPLMLINVGRFAEAEQRLRRVLLADPQNASAHILLSQCLLERQEFDEASREAETAVGLQPDASASHFAVARVWYARHYADKAMQAIDEAIRLDPHDADYHAFKAALQFNKSRWKEALASAESALAIDPEHVSANNFRAMALVKLGRRSEAGQTIDAALARDPEDAFSHANKGWTLLEARKPKEALHHFREALRLEPNLEYARLGIIEALKARNPIYGLFLRYALWMAKLPPRWQVGVILGAYFGNQVLQSLTRSYPGLAPFTLPIFIIYLVFAWWTWLARPMFNLLLRLHPLGKHALSTKERREANWIGALIGCAIVTLAASFFSEEWGWPLLLAAWWFLSLTIPIYLIFLSSEGWPRMILLGSCGLLIMAIAGAGYSLLTLDGDGFRRFNDLHIYTFIAIMWGGQFVAAARPKR